MKLFRKAKDGGSESTVTGYFLIEWKRVFSIVLLRFDKGSRDNFHSHAFNAYTILLKGDMTEQRPPTRRGMCREEKPYRLFRIKKTLRQTMHRVWAYERSWAISFRGPWGKYWQEVTPEGGIITLTHGRKVVKHD